MILNGADVVEQAATGFTANALTAEEQGWIERIEGLRAQLIEKTDEITITDHGAGDPGARRTPEQMQAGVATNQALGEFVARSSSAPSWGSFLFKLVRTARPTSCVELGTGVGISACYQAAALRLNGRGTLVTLEGARSLADVARAGFDRLGLDNVEIAVGRFADTLPRVLASARSIDYAFVDGHHDQRATLTYFEQITACMERGSLLVFDDINWSVGMKRAWAEIARHERVDAAVELGQLGLCAVGVAR